MVTTGKIHRSSFHHTCLSSSGLTTVGELQDDSDDAEESPWSFSRSVDAEEGVLGIVPKRSDKENETGVDRHAQSDVI